MLGGFDDLDFETACIPSIVVGYLWFGVIEQCGAIGVPDNHRHLSIALVGAVTYSNKTSTVLRSIEKVKIDRFVEVFFWTQLVGVVVFWLNIADNFHLNASL